MRKSDSLGFFKLPKPTNELSFFEEIKDLSEEYWSCTMPNERLYGFQIQQGTKWRKGLTENEICDFEASMGFEFPEALRNFYRTMNGIDKKGINLFGNSGLNHTFASIYYSFPDDLGTVKEKIDFVYRANNLNENDLKKQRISRIFPVCGHRFVLIDSTHQVLSIVGTDIIPWSDNISKLLATDIFSNIHNVSDFESNTNDFNVEFWLADREQD